MQQDETPESGPPSKSARKRAATALQDLGVQLAELRDTELEDLDLPDTLLQAVRTLRELKSHGAQVRQRQYIGKLMRHIDAQAVQDRLTERKRRHDGQIHQFRRIEQWRDRLLTAPAEGVPALLRDYPQADAAALQRLLDRVSHEQRGGRPPAAARELFGWLRDLLTPTI